MRHNENKRYDHETYKMLIRGWLVPGQGPITWQQYALRELALDGYPIKTGEWSAAKQSTRLTFDEYAALTLPRYDDQESPIEAYERENALVIAWLSISS